MKRKGFTLIELIVVLVVTAIFALIATPLVMNIIRNSKENARKRSIDNYGKSIELAIASYLLDNGNFPTDVSQLNIEYSGSKVECGVEVINKDTTVYLDKCKVNNKLVDNYKYGIDKRTAVEVLLSKTNSIDITNYNDGNKGEMYTFEHETTEQTPALTDYRYIGNVPNNYVSFNNGETWRIIGVFDTDNGTGKYENRIKLIRDESLGNMIWNSSSENEWVESTIQEYLNDTYIINNESMYIIDNTKYYLGGIVSARTNGEQLYVTERGKNVYQSDRSLSWIGNVGLMYPSDYVYTYALDVDSTCFNNSINCTTNSGASPLAGWMYNNEYVWTWSIIPNSSDNYHVIAINRSGFVHEGSVGHSGCANFSYAIKPVLYLNSNVKIKQGDGSIDNPYVFEL